VLTPAAANDKDLHADFTVSDANICGPGMDKHTVLKYATNTLPKQLLL
jgi:hypothetical protein